MTPVGMVKIVDESTFTFDSVDNTTSYPHVFEVGGRRTSTSTHGIHLDAVPLAIIGAGGGPTGVHVHSGVYVEDVLLLAVGDHVVALQLAPFRVAWALEVDEATCFGVHHHPPSGALISHGELSIARFDLTGRLVWRRHGADVFSGALSLERDGVRAVDFYDRPYVFAYADGADGTRART